MSAIKELRELAHKWRRFARSDCDPANGSPIVQMRGRAFSDAATELESIIPKLEAEIAALNEQIALMLADKEYTQRQYEVDQAVLTEHKAYCNTCLIGRPCQRLEQLEMANRALKGTK